MRRLSSLLTSWIASAVGFSEPELHPWLEIPPDPKLGDLAFPCFRLAKQLRKAPAQIARSLADQLIGSLSRDSDQPAAALVEEIRVTGAYVNIFLRPEGIAAWIIESIRDEGDSWGGSEEGRGKTIVIDYSSPNIAKPFHIGHLRSTVIGHSLKRIHEALGYRCVGVNHIGDWGTQFGRLMAAYARWGRDDDLESRGLEEILELYVRFTKEAKADPNLEKEGNTWFARLERGDQEARQLLERFTRLSLANFQRIYELLGVSFEAIQGESFYEPLLEGAIAEVEQRGLLETSRGVQLVDLSDHGLPPFRIRREDGTTLYATRDLAAAIYRQDTYHFAKCIYVVGAPQELHFRQLFAVLEKMGFPWARDCVHVKFGHVRFRDRKMSTREGDIVLLEDVVERAIHMADSIIAAKHPSLENRQRVAHQIGVGAIVFNDLKQGRVKDIVFDWDQLLNFDGDTGPYVQYTHARLASLQRKYARDLPLHVDASLLRSAEEKALALRLARYPDVVAAAASEFEPSTLAQHLLSIADAFNGFYQVHRVLGDDRQTTDARMALCQAAQVTLRRGLSLLGIAAPESM